MAKKSRLSAGKLDEIKRNAGNVYKRAKQGPLKDNLLNVLSNIQLAKRPTDTAILVPIYQGKLLSNSEWVAELINLDNQNELRKQQGLSPLEPLEVGLINADLEKLKDEDPALYNQIMIQTSGGKQASELYTTKWRETIALGSSILQGKKQLLDTFSETKVTGDYFVYSQETTLTYARFIQLVLANKPTAGDPKNNSKLNFTIETSTMYYLGSVRQGNWGADFTDSLRKSSIVAVTNPSQEKDYQVGHLLGVKTGDSLYTQYEILKNVRERARWEEAKALRKLAVSPHLSKVTKTEIEDQSKQRLADINELIEGLQIIIPYGDTIDRLIFDITDVETGKNITAERGSTIFGSLVKLTHLAGNNQLFIVEEITPGTASVRGGTSAVDLSAVFLSPENRKGNDNVKGRTFSRYLSDIWKRYLRGVINNKELALELGLKFGSSSLVSRILLKALDDIFNTKNFSKEIVQPKKEKRIVYKSKVKFSNKDRVINKFKKAAKRRGQILKNLFKKSSKRSNKKSQLNKIAGKYPGSLQQTENIVPLINAELKRYVIEEMSYPSLENRSGQFAGSVRVLSAQENAAVQYTYQKSPYQVFSPARGKRPWATEERDPAKIIDRAIKRIGQDRFQKVFRTEER